MPFLPKGQKLLSTGSGSVLLSCFLWLYLKFRVWPGQQLFYNCSAELMKNPPVQTAVCLLSSVMCSVCPGPGGQTLLQHWGCSPRGVLCGLSLLAVPHYSNAIWREGTCLPLSASVTHTHSSSDNAATFLWHHRFCGNLSSTLPHHRNALKWPTHASVFCL